ncbi:MAG: hypothetical protein K6F64_06665 [Clostridia bacterium]|nr:hypothetical protein [Clostridia bacterium]
MKSGFKKALCPVLAAIILLGCIVPAFASEGKTAFVVISGMNTFPLYDENEEKVYPFSTGDIIKLAGRLVSPVASFLVTKNYDRLAEKVIPVLYDAFKPIACGSDGLSSLAVHTRIFKGSMAENKQWFEGKTKDEEGIVNAGIEKFGEENVYFFNYDWRLSPLTHADTLNDFVREIKHNSGYDRVVLAAFSMGGTVLCSYLQKYGSADVDTVMLCSTAFQGTSVVTELFSGEVNLDARGLINRLAQLTRNNFFEDLIKYVNERLTLSGVNENISDYVNDIVINCKDEIYSGLLIPVFGYMGGLWALTSSDGYENAKNFMLKNADESFIALTDEYIYDVQQKATGILENAAADSQVYIFAQYNMQGLPVSKESNTGNNDYLIDCKYASGGAVCAPLGEILDVNPGQYISPDRQIDASTCMFPDKTWFIRDMGHVDYPLGGGSDFVLYFACADEQLTVETSLYPQFSKYSYSDKTVTPVTAQEKKTFADKFFDFLIGIATRIHSFISRCIPVFS